MNVRPVTYDELEILFYWERADNVEGFIYSRIIQLCDKGWKPEDIALAMGVELGFVNEVVLNFNSGGISAIAPKP
ncbi:MAG: helix-turn-helix domain-containing protein [Anaerolineae bacterium]|nr:helix-turn-helix domain-containing protein [Anaerolineae bacterium]